MKNPYSLASRVDLVKSGNDFFERAYVIIDNSKHTIHLQTYIFSDDETGLEAIEHLAAAVKRGVNVFLLIDAFGSHELGSETIKRIKAKGIQFRTYSPLFSGYHIRFGRRLHHKILVSDEQEALVGGINFDNNYHLPVNGPWLDYAVYVRGPVCDEISRMCCRLWSGRGYFRKKKKMPVEEAQTDKSHHPIAVKLDQNDWLYGKKGVSRSLNNAIRHSHSSVTIMASYFLPGGKIRRSLESAARRNVKVKIILPGMSDVKLVQFAAEYWYTWMLRNNMEIYEWSKTILHAKLMSIDDDWTSIGSYNINHLSHFSSIETNLEIKDESFSNMIKSELENVMGNCYRITPDENKKRVNLAYKFLYWCSFQIIRFLFSFQFAILSKE